MSLLLRHSLAEATAIFRGECASGVGREVFPLEDVTAWRLTGLVGAPGHAELDSDAAWDAIVRSWWGLGLTWGLCATGESGRVNWNLVLPTRIGGARQAITTHLTGARLEPNVGFTSTRQLLQRLPYQAVYAGHPGTGPAARLEPAVRSLLGDEFMILVMARAIPRPEIQAEVQRLAGEEQFVRDDYLARPGLDRDNHAGAARYLALVEAARDRALAALQEGGWLIRTLVATPDQERLNQVCSLVHGGYSGDGGNPEPLRWQRVDDPRKLTFLRSAEAAALTRPPRREMPGFLVESTIREGQSVHGLPTGAIFAIAPSPVAPGRAISLGRILDDHGAAGAWLEIGINELCRHVLVAGMTGSGKSVTCEHLLLELWREHRIPWLVIEPGLKTGYRRLKNSEIGADLDLWAVGDPRSRRLPLNPMAVPPGVGLAEHTSALFTVISSAFELVAPMPEVLAAAIEQTYRNHGWNLAGFAPATPSPTLADLVHEIDRSASGLGYGPEVTGNIRAGLLLRMRRLLEGPLAPELSSPSGLNVGELVLRPVLIELSALSDGPTQALVMGLIALQLRHHWRLAGQSDELRHVLLIEEAHRLLKAVPERSTNASRTQAVESLANMLAEMRGLGVGMVIVDQTPSALVSSVIANTGTKILHRLDHPADRELAGRSTGLPHSQIDLLGALPIGGAILRSDRRTRPFRLHMPNPAITYGRLPLPMLPPPPAPESSGSLSFCPVCGCHTCTSAVLGADRAQLTRRMAALQQALREGTEATWRWAGQELNAANVSEDRGQSALCFLLSLGVSAGLSPATLARLREAFKDR